MRGSFTIGRIAGIEIGIHYTWLIIFFLIAWSLAAGLFPELYPGWSSSTYWVIGVISAFLLFISVLIHELCHSLVAIHRGMKVHSIVLFIFGGVSNLEGEPEKASVEFVMSIAGPLSSLALGGIFYLIKYALASSGDDSSPLFAVMNYMAFINILLAIFNILPGFPLDGGRVLRSIIWGATRSLKTATAVAGNVGRIFGWALIALGILLIFGVGFQIGSLVFQGLISGIWLIFIGWFLTSAADNAMRELSLKQALVGIHVKDVMDRTPECVSPATPVESIVHESFIQRGRRALPICTESGLVGIVTLADVKRLPQDRWANTPVQEIMTRNPLQSVDENDDLNNALTILGEKGLNQIPVMSGGHLVGLLSRADVIRYLQTKKELGIKQGQNPRISS
jgi:Zn-dependent protease/CBS domain-containing protein